MNGFNPVSSTSDPPARYRAVPFAFFGNPLETLAILAKSQDDCRVANIRIGVSTT